MSSSAFTPSVLTIPASGTSGSGTGEISAISNGSAATDATGWTVATRSTSNSPLNPVTTTCFQINAAAAAESATSGGYTSFTMPSGLQNKKLKVEFYFTTPATDDYRVSVYKNGTRATLTTDAGGFTSLPKSTTGKFVAYFDADNTGPYTLNVTRVTGSTGPIFLTNVIVGPGIQPQGAVVGGWQSYTPVGTWTSNTNYTGQYRRVGDSIDIIASINLTGAPNNTALYVSLPTGLTPDTSKISTSNFEALGTAELQVANAAYIGSVIYVSDSPRFLRVLHVSNGTTGAQSDLTSTTPDTWATGSRVSIRASVPIAEWAGSGTQQLAQNDVEYAYNTSTSDAADTTSFGYGPTGNQLPTVTTTRAKRVRFQKPIQSTDSFRLEVSSDRVKWTDIALTATDGSTFTIQPFLKQGGVDYGMGRLTIVNSTDVDVAFATYSQSNNAAYGGAGANWSFTAYWRLVKSSAGAAVGFGIVVPGTSSGLVSASGLPGNTTGNAIASGYVGEEIVQETTTTTATTGNPNIALITYTMPAGAWLVSGSVRVFDGATSGVTAIACNLNDDALSLGAATNTFNTAISSFQGIVSCQPRVLTSNGSTQVVLRYFIGGTFENGTDALSGRLRLVRIA
jgi:hypothetical protein